MCAGIRDTESVTRLSTHSLPGRTCLIRRLVAVCAGAALTPISSQGLSPDQCGPISTQELPSFTDGTDRDPALKQPGLPRSSIALQGFLTRASELTCKSSRSTTHHYDQPDEPPPRAGLTIDYNLATLHRMRRVRRGCLIPNGRRVGSTVVRPVPVVSAVVFLPQQACAQGTTRPPSWCRVPNRVDV